jgi:hypothetical protein
MGAVRELLPHGESVDGLSIAQSSPVRQLGG